MEPLPKIVRVSEKIYRRLLCLYPAAHRRDYAEAMAQLFRDQCRDAWQTGRSAGLIRLWLRVLPDLGKTSAIERVAAIERNQIMKSINSKNVPTILLLVGLTLCFLSFSPFIPSREVFQLVIIVSSLVILAKAVVELFRPGNEWLSILVRTLALMFFYALFMPAWAKLQTEGALINFPQSSGSSQALGSLGVVVAVCLFANPVVALAKLITFLIQRRKS